MHKSATTLRASALVAGGMRLLLRVMEQSEDVPYGTRITPDGRLVKRGIIVRGGRRKLPRGEEAPGEKSRGQRRPRRHVSALSPTGHEGARADEAEHPSHVTSTEEAEFARNTGKPSEEPII